MPSKSVDPQRRDRVVVAVDPHKASWTAVAVDPELSAVDTLRVPVNRDGFRRLRRFAAAWPQATWAIEGAGGLGAPLTERLRADGIAVVDVPAKLARRVRLLSTGHGRKNDEADALSIGMAAWSAPDLHTVAVDEQIAALRALTEHRDDLVRTRTQTVNRLHALLVKTHPVRPARGLTADTAATALRGTRPRSDLGRTMRALAVELVAEVRRLDHRVANTDSWGSGALSVVVFIRGGCGGAGERSGLCRTSVA